MAYNTGTNVGPYEIAEQLGVGGMGEVYRATDTRLRRDVAIKFSTERFTERFEREARAVAALNHPNICTLFDVGPNYLVMELVEGPTLADRIRQGPIPMEEALAIARQIGDALEAAHEKGIVHRDLKPANIKIRLDGTVKVLDFGLAKDGNTTSSNPHDSPTLSLAATEAGIVLGTAGYMSPEQSRGKTVDKRADIWAFGVVLYEMLAGQHPFQGEDVSETLAAVIKEEPKWDRIPANMQRLLKKCMQKDPKQRLRDIGDAWALVEDRSISTVPASAKFKVIVSSVAVGLVIVLGALAWTLASWPSSSSPAGRLMRFDISPPENAIFNTALNVTAGHPQFALSPDGRALAFVAAVAGAKPLLWIRSFEEVEAHALAGTDNAEYPFWSPENDWVAFFAQGRLKKVRAAGGPVQDVSDTPDPRGGSWGSDGTIIFGNGTTGLYRIAPGSRTATALTTLEASTKEGSHRWPHFLPDGNHFIFTIRGSTLDQRGIYVGSLDGKIKRLLIRGDLNAVYVSPGFLLFMDGSTLSAQALDPERLELSGQPFVVADGIGRATNGSAAISASRSGTIAYAHIILQTGRLTWFDRRGRPGETVGVDGDYTDLRLSRNEKRLAASLIDRQTGNPDIWLTDLDRGGSPFRFTSGPALNSAPAWSPDASRIVFRTTRNGGQVELYQKSTGGAGSEEPVLLAGTQLEGGLGAYNGGQPDWSPDGSNILYTSLSSSGFGLWLISTADRKMSQLLQAPFRGMHANFSPDGRFLSYASDESGLRMEVYVHTFPISDRKWKISSSGGYEPRWRADGREIYYLTEDRKLMAVSVGPGPSFGAPELLFQTRVPGGVNAFRTHYAPTADGQRFLVNTLNADPAPIPITVVLNWTAATKK